MYRYVVCMYLPSLLLSKTNQFYNNAFYKYNFFQSIFSTCVYTVYTCVHAYVFLMCASVCLHVCTYVYTSNFTYVCVCLYTFMHTYAAELPLRLFACYLLICTTRSCYQSDTRTYKSK